ncbi:AT-rich interactive domain-containing protein 3 like protein, partial [Aduncisulcus paluster]
MVIAKKKKKIVIPAHLLTLESRNRFDSILSQCWKRSRRKIKPPILGRKPLDLYRLFLEVDARGGLCSVMNHKLFREVGDALELPKTVTNVGWILRCRHEQLLSPYISILRERIWPESPGALDVDDQRYFSSTKVSVSNSASSMDYSSSLFFDTSSKHKEEGDVSGENDYIIDDSSGICTSNESPPSLGRHQGKYQQQTLGFSDFSESTLFGSVDSSQSSSSSSSSSSSTSSSSIQSSHSNVDNDIAIADGTDKIKASPSVRLPISASLSTSIPPLSTSTTSILCLRSAKSSNNNQIIPYVQPQLQLESFSKLFTSKSHKHSSHQHSIFRQEPSSSDSSAASTSYHPSQTKPASTCDDFSVMMSPHFNKRYASIQETFAYLMKRYVLNPNNPSSNNSIHSSSSLSSSPLSPSTHSKHSTHHRHKQSYIYSTSSSKSHTSPPPPSWCDLHSDLHSDQENTIHPPIPSVPPDLPPMLLCPIISVYPMCSLSLCNLPQLSEYDLR